jgi:cation diffusion facilitator CzcD-associated flavoprotein CzcO
VIGSSSSAFDISRDIAGVAKEIHIASRSLADETIDKKPGYDNMWLHSMVRSMIYNLITVYSKDFGDYDKL